MANGEFEMLPGANVLVFGSTKKRPINNVTYISLNGEGAFDQKGDI